MNQITIWNTPYHPAQEVAVEQVLPALNKQIDSATANTEDKQGSREAIITALIQVLADQLPGNTEAVILYR